MAGITHSKVSAIEDGDDEDLIRPVDWNAAHVIASGTSFPTDPAPAEKDLFYRTDEHKFYIYNGSAWVELTITGHKDLTTGVHGVGAGTVGIMNADKTIQDADGDTKIQVEESADEDIIRMDVAGTEAFKLSNIGIQILAKQSTSKAYLDGDLAGIVASTVTKVPLNAEAHDIQNEFNTRKVTGTADATESNKLHDADGGFEAADVGATVRNTTDNTATTVSGFVDSGELDLTDNIMANGENYILFHARWTATEDGKYLAIGSIGYMATNMTDQKSHQARIDKNGTNASAMVLPASGASQFNPIAMEVIDMAANDYLELSAWHNGTSGNMSLRGLVGQTYLTVMKVA